MTEVTCSAFIVDFNWNCIAEFTGVTSSVVDTTNGRLTLADTTYIYPTGLTFGEGYYQFKIQRSAASGSITLLVGNNEINITNAGAIAFNGGTAETYTIDPTNAVNVELLVGTTSITVYADRVLKGTKTGLTIAASNVKMKMATANFYVYDIIINAESSDTTSGVVACVGGIGSGARYGVEESVYNTFTTANVDKGVYLTSAKVKTTNPNADEVSLEYVNETTSTTLDNTSIVVDADYTIKTTPITIKENETDVLTVGVKNSTTCNQPATYVESLSLIPVSGNSVLYPQDLAFISGVKPSQKRKVEVK
jgi:hypothetical protein